LRGGANAPTKQSPLNEQRELGIATAAAPPRDDRQIASALFGLSSDSSYHLKKAPGNKSWGSLRL